MSISTMKTILITGATSGIGRSIAHKILEHNHDCAVVGIGRNHRKFQPNHANYYPYTLDLSQVDTVESSIKNIHRQHPNIDTIICSAGFGHFVELEQFSVARMTEMMNVNFLSQAILIKYFIPFFKKNNQGQIIVMGSECALEGQKKGTMYCASKFAFDGFIQSLRKETAKSNIAITCINPGLVLTEFFDTLSFIPDTNENAYIQPQQIASLVLHILNEKNNCVFENINLQPLKKSIKTLTRNQID